MVNPVLKPAIGDSRPVWQIWVGAPPNQKVIDPLFFGLVPGLAGVYQVNFIVPEGLGAGSQPVRLIANGCETGFGTCIAIPPPEAVSLPVPMAVQ